MVKNELKLVCSAKKQDKGAMFTLNNDARGSHFAVTEGNVNKLFVLFPRK